MSPISTTELNTLDTFKNKVIVIIFIIIIIQGEVRDFQPSTELKLWNQIAKMCICQIVCYLNRY